MVVVIISDHLVHPQCGDVAAKLSLGRKLGPAESRHTLLPPVKGKGTMLSPTHTQTHTPTRTHIYIYMYLINLSLGRKLGLTPDSPPPPSTC